MVIEIRKVVFLGGWGALLEKHLEIFWNVVNILYLNLHNFAKAHRAVYLTFVSSFI